MEDPGALGEVLRRADVVRMLAEFAAAHEAAFAADLRVGVRRAVVAGDLDLRWDGLVLQSAWLVSHRALRRAGLRRHPESTAALVAWRGSGLVNLRGPGERRSVTLVPIAEPAPDDAVHAQKVAAGTPYDTLADAMPWHLVAFHTHAAAGLVREESAESGWIAKPEESA